MSPPAYRGGHVKKAFYICSSACLAALAVCYGVWVSEQKDIGILSVVTSILVTLLFGVLLIWLVKAIIDAWFGKRDEDTVRPLLRTDGARRYEVLKVGAYILVSRFVVFLLVYLMYTAMHGYKGGILDTLEEIWKRFDSPSYLGIAERWYVTSGDPQYHIVFFPLFPIVIRLFNYITGNTFASAMLVSLLSSVGAGMMLYKLLLIDYSEKISKFTVLLVFIFPAAFFFSAPMTESLFLLISVTCLYFTRKKLYLFAGVFGALAAFTRSQGVLLMVPMGIEAVRELIIMFKTKDKNAWRGLASRLTGIIIVPVGLLMYIWVNYSVWGDAFKFLEIQREHWSQGLSFFFNTVSYQTDLFIRNLDKVNVETAWGLWFSNLAAIFGTLIIVICGAKKLRASYLGYFAAYFVMSIGATWLISAPRYMTVAFPVMLALATMCKKWSKKIITIVVIAAMSLLYTAAFVAGNYQIW